MADRKLSVFLSRVRGMAARGDGGGVTDAELLGRFVSGRDEAAFELLVRRHEGMVFSVCRRVLQDVHDAEDAFQATFLALARKGGRIARRQAVAGWLYRVACRMALTVRADRTRRTTREQPIQATRDVAAPLRADLAPEWGELRGILDEELNRLPERFRTPTVLCYLEGKSVGEAARQLGCPRGTVA
ncbi:MAG TPA: sigma-70 family RNA polymerase sigma factor, partial [Gemmataceae bacterium]|nr:sigma-70 family RNA polymerase sigma factor [Gemmataceae bacterium]